MIRFNMWGQPVRVRDELWDRELAPFPKMTVRERAAAIRALESLIRIRAADRKMNSSGDLIRSMIHSIRGIDPHMREEALAEVSHVSKWTSGDDSRMLCYALVKIPGSVAVVQISHKAFDECIKEGADLTNPDRFLEILETRRQMGFDVSGELNKEG